MTDLREVRARIARLQRHLGKASAELEEGLSDAEAVRRFLPSGPIAAVDAASLAVESAILQLREWEAENPPAVAGDGGCKFARGVCTVHGGLSYGRNCTRHPTAPSGGGK